MKKNNVSLVIELVRPVIREESKIVLNVLITTKRILKEFVKKFKKINLNAMIDLTIVKDNKLVYAEIEISNISK